MRARPVIVLAATSVLAYESAWSFVRRKWLLGAVLGGLAGVVLGSAGVVEVLRAR